VKETLKKRKGLSSRRPSVLSAKNSRSHVVLFKTDDGDEILKIDKLVYVLFRTCNNSYISQSFTPSEWSMYCKRVGFLPGNE